MPRLTTEFEKRARDLMALYPQPRSALLPLCHLAQEQDGHLTEEGIRHIAELLEITPAEVLSVASFYDMFHTEPVGRYLVMVCTNIACMLNGGEELLEHAEHRLGIRPGGVTTDGLFGLEEVECIAACNKAPCLQVNYRYFGDVTEDGFDTLVDDLKAGRHDADVPPHGTLIRTRRDSPLQVSAERLETERRATDEQIAGRAAAKKAADEAAAKRKADEEAAAAAAEEAKAKAAEQAAASTPDDPAAVDADAEQKAAADEAGAAVAAETMGAPESTEVANTADTKKAEG